MPHADNRGMPYPKEDFDEVFDQEHVKSYFGESLKGLLKITGYAVLAVIAGYSAGVAQENYRTSRNKRNSGFAEAHR
jgi:hypothetical protein